MNNTTDSTGFDWSAYGGRDYGYTAEPTTATSTTTAKQTNRGIRVWLENKSKLELAGFHAGATYTATNGNGIVVLTLDVNGKGRVSSCKRGDAVRPIIDLHSKALEAVFTAGQTLVVHYRAGVITITGNR